MASQSLFVEYEQQILSDQVINILLNGEKKAKTTTTRRLVRFDGFQTLSNKMKTQYFYKPSGFQDIISRSYGRTDYQLSNKFIQQTGIAEDLKTSGIVNQVQKWIQKTCGKIPILRTINVMVVEPGAIDQPIHTDVPGTKRGEKFATVIVALNTTTKAMGGTELFTSRSKTKKSIIV